MECDPIASGRINNHNQLVPLTLSDLFSSVHGSSGLFLAALSSVTLSSTSSSLNRLVAMTYDDLIPIKYPNMSQKPLTNAFKLSVFVYGIVAMFCTFVISSLPGYNQVISLFYRA